MLVREGHRQYVCREMRGSKKQGNIQLCMVNCCGPDDRQVRIWISLEELRDKNRWRAGWTTLQLIRVSKEINSGALVDAKVCKCVWFSMLK